jgi:hypothetical protein
MGAEEATFTRQKPCVPAPCRPVVPGQPPSAVRIPTPVHAPVVPASHRQLCEPTTLVTPPSPRPATIGRTIPRSLRPRRLGQPPSVARIPSLGHGSLPLIGENPPPSPASPSSRPATISRAYPPRSRSPHSSRPAAVSCAKTAPSSTPHRSSRAATVSRVPPSPTPPSSRAATVGCANPQPRPRPHRPRQPSPVARIPGLGHGPVARPGQPPSVIPDQPWLHLFSGLFLLPSRRPGPTMVVFCEVTVSGVTE